MSARPGPCGGRSAMIVPTAIAKGPGGKRRVVRDRCLNVGLALQQRKPQSRQGIELPRVETRREEIATYIGSLRNEYRARPLRFS
jgi:hypothetical protein